MLNAMDDLGQPSSYLEVRPGMGVYSSDGQKVGEVEHLLCEPEEDIFDGIVLDTEHRFVEGALVEEVFERGVVLKIDAAAAQQLGQYSGKY